MLAFVGRISKALFRNQLLGSQDSKTIFKVFSSSNMPPKRKVTKEVAEAGGEPPVKKEKKKASKKAADAADDGDVEVKKSKKEKNNENKAKKTTERAAIPDVSAMDFSSTATDKRGNKWNWKFSSWNVNGIRAWLDKNGHSYISAEDPDIFCVQETKCEKAKIPKECEVPGYHVYWLSGDKDGYSGTGLYSKKEPVSVKYGLGIDKHDKEGRVITAEYDNFYFVTAYIPNAGRGLPRLDYRSKEWDPDFRNYLTNLDKTKPVILCGDLNVAHNAIDLANPKSNKRGPGFTQEERDGFTALLDEGFLDSFRELYPEQEAAYSYWTYMMNARAKNVGWRLDYFVISKRLRENLCDSLIRKDVMGSDHCPIVCLLHL